MCDARAEIIVNIFGQCGRVRDRGRVALEATRSRRICCRDVAVGPARAEASRMDEAPKQGVFAKEKRDFEAQGDASASPGTPIKFSSFTRNR